MSKIPQSKEELEQILKKSFDYYESIGQPVIRNYQTDYWERQLELRKERFVESDFEKEEWNAILGCCRNLIEFSQPIGADVFDRSHPTAEMYNNMKLLFNDEKELKSIHTQKTFKVNELLSDKTFKLPTFEIKSDIEHPNKAETQTLFSLFEDGKEYTVGTDKGTKK